MCYFLGAFFNLPLFKCESEGEAGEFIESISLVLDFTVLSLCLEALLDLRPPV